LPEEPWVGIYAEIVDATEPIFAKKNHGIDAACGRWVRAYLPQPFDSQDRRSCQACKDAIGVKG